ncbi:hypothetical protein [Streptomyces sp. Mg1]|uniref:hypothetical protein n=1 Tax=Streptomyces sp. Mg1 TaxID=465541 RepID=UPI00017E8061|nr:hypothetical protein [Streptomyces sp. Mg1]EDX24770.1 hypothetical protein SSAG_04641 [Streptomyces sp. Mg1]
MAGRFDPLTRTASRGGRVDVPAPGRGPGQGGGKQRVWVSDGPLDLGLTLGPLRRGPGDPTFRVAPDGAVWKTARTPAGPATLRITGSGSGSGSGTAGATATAWGPGADWAARYFFRPPRSRRRLFFFAMSCVRIVYAQSLVTSFLLLSFAINR